MNDVGYLRQADQIKQETNFTYTVNKPKGILNSYLFKVDQRHHWSFGGENLMDELDSYAMIKFKNLWVFQLDFDNTLNYFDTRQLRGGPSLRIDNSTSTDLYLQSNASKKFWIGSGFDMTRFRDKISLQNEFSFDVYWQISNRFLVSSNTEFAEEKYYHQYVKQETVNEKKDYVVAKINRETLFTTLRVEYFITPELSLQYYGSPYASTGKYDEFRKVNQSKEKDLSQRYSPLFVVDDGENQILVDEDDNLLLDFSTENPDFDYQEFNSNFVLRWEYKTGSTFYFVWTNSISNYINQYNPSIIESIKNIGKGTAQNAFMIKLSYWFSL
jgi:hypothetical protein